MEEEIRNNPEIPQDGDISAQNNTEQAALSEISASDERTQNAENIGKNEKFPANEAPEDNENKPEPEDARAEITCDKEYSRAALVLHEPRHGGKHITFEDIKRELEVSRVCYGLLVDDEFLKSAAETKLYEQKIELAKWTAPADGQNGYVEYYYERGKVAAPVEDETGCVDYKNLGIITNIVKGTKIGVIHEPTEGEPGTNVLGQKVTQKHGVPAKFSVGKGTVLSEDQSSIVAAVDGNLVYNGREFVIEENLNIKGDVDLSTGNIDFIGNVNINGNVFEGFRVSSKKNITIKGAVAGAEIIAGGDVNIKLGCLQSRVVCRGSFKSDFCENSFIECQKNVEAGSFISCEVNSQKKIVASGKGFISGGKYTAMEDISAVVIGSGSYVKTEITLGNNAVLTKEREQHEAAIEDLENKLAQVEKILTTLDEIQKTAGKLPPNREQMRIGAVKMKLMAQNDIKKFKSRIEQINMELEKKESFSVACKQRMFPGVFIRIDEYTLAVSSENCKCKAVVLNGEIQIVPL